MQTKFFSLLLALMMLLSAFSLTALADGEGGDGAPIEGGESALTGRALSDYYASFYAPGATAILVAYNAESDGTVVLENGAGTWQSLTADGGVYTLNGVNKSFTVGGTEYVGGWRLDGSKLGYDMPFEWIKHNKAEEGHSLTLPVSLVGDKHTSTVEVVASVESINIDANTQKFSDKDGSGTLTAGDQFMVYNNFFGGRNYALVHIYEGLYANGMTKVETAGTYIAYNDSGRWQDQGGNGAIYSQNFDGKTLRFIVTEEKKNDTQVTVVSGFRYDGDSYVRDYSHTNEKEIIEAGASTLSFLENTPCRISAIRVYDRVLSEEELLQNHFVDLAFKLRVDLSGLEEMDAEIRELALFRLGGLVANLTDETATKEVLESMIKKVVYNVSARAKTERYAELYAPGATAILLAYGAKNNDGTVVLENGAGTWLNLVNDESYAIVGKEESYTVNGEEKITGWHLNDDGSVGYRTAFGIVKGKQNRHEIVLPASLLGDEHTSTIEIVSKYYALDIADNGKDAYTAGQTLTQLSTSFGGKNLVALHIYETAFSEDLYANPTKATYLDYNMRGRWIDKNRAQLSTEGGEGLLRRFVAQDSVTKDGVESLVSYYADGLTAVTSTRFTVEKPATSASEMVVAQNVASDIYAIRTYDRCLTTAELMQNHFADLCAYYQLEVDNFIEIVPDEIKTKIYAQWSAYTFDSRTKEQLQRSLDEAFAMSFFTFDGIAIKTEGKENELAAIFTTEEATINEYIENGYTVEYGILMAKKGEISSVSELIYGLEGAKGEVLFDSNGGGARKYLEETEDGKTFGYSVYFDEFTRPTELAAEYFFRAYIRLIAEDGTELVAYVSASSGKLGEEFSLFEVARYLNKNVTAYAFNEKLTVLVDDIYEVHDYYLDSVNGSDENDGKSEAYAFKTVEAAFAALVEFINANQATPIKLNLHFPKGDTCISEAITLYGDEIRGNLYTINFIGHADGSSTINGTVKVDGSEFVEYEDGIYAYPLPEHLMGEQFRALYVNGKSAELAHTNWFVAMRNEYGFVDLETGETYWVIYVASEALIGIVEKVYNPSTGEEEWQYCEGVNDTSFEWFCRMQWQIANIRVVGVDFEHSDTIITGKKHDTLQYENKNCEGYIALRLHEDDGEDYRTHHSHVGPLEGGGHAKGEFSYRLANHLAFLDAENEFYYDEAEGILYYIPRAGVNIAELTFEIPLAEELLVLENLSNITFENLTFYGTGSNHTTNYGHNTEQAGKLTKETVTRERSWNDDAAIVGRNLSWLTVKNCSFIGLEYHGIYLAGEISNIEITGCNFDEIGASAIAAPTTVKMVSVTNNYLHNIADTYYSANAIFFMKAYELDVLYNSIVNCAYSGVSVGWSWKWDYGDPVEDINVDYVEVAYNYIENCMYFMNDGGAVYFNGGAANISYNVLYNSIHDNYAFIGSREGHATCPKTSTCWYIDGGGSHTYIYDNVIWVDTEALSKYSYIAYQGSDNWIYNYEEPAQQAYRVTSENNYFINLVQPYLTVGIGRAKALFYLYEINSVLFTQCDLYGLANELLDIYDQGGLNEHGEKMQEYMLINPDDYRYAVENMDEVNEVYSIVAAAGCEANAKRPLARASAFNLEEFYQLRVDNYKNAEVDKTMNDWRYDPEGDNVADKDLFH